MRIVFVTMVRKEIELTYQRIANNIQVRASKSQDKLGVVGKAGAAAENCSTRRLLQ
jgi:hypothetical protein